MVNVTVIIPCRNQGDTLERAVNSALKAGANEVLVFNDNSSDDTSAIAIALHKAGSIIFYQPEKDFRSGVAYSRNQLIKESLLHGWIIPLDADDELLRIPPIPQDWREWVYGGWIEHYEDGSEETFTAPPPKMISRKPLCHATMMFSKQLWANLGGYDPDFFYGEDYGFQCALYAANSNLATRLDYPLYKRYIGKNERTEKAKKYWPIILDMAKSKWPSVFL